MNKKDFDVNSIGTKVRKVMIERGMSITELAAGIHRARTVCYDIFQRRSIDSGLLADLSVALNYNFFEALSSQIEDELSKTSSH